MTFLGDPIRFYSDKDDCANLGDFRHLIDVTAKNTAKNLPPRRCESIYAAADRLGKIDIVGFDRLPLLRPTVKRVKRPLLRVNRHCSIEDVCLLAFEMFMKNTQLDIHWRTGKYTYQGETFYQT